MRGDRPDVVVVPVAGEWATPHARGSTRYVDASGLSPAGYPACAGIDPGPARSTMRWVGLPRMRGDRPCAPSPERWPPRATPHARGSTRASGVDRQGQSGYPACAGIDLTKDTRYVKAPGLPRMRGDRPTCEAPRRPDCWATPHARGSTTDLCCVPTSQLGYPACAGIDPTALPCSLAT